MVKCSTCGYEAEESYFCPNCGSKITKVENNENIDNDINVDAEDNESKADDNSKNDKKSSGGGFIANKLKKSSSVDKFFDKVSSVSRNNIDNSANRKLFEKTEPAFLEVFDSVEDDFIKSILILEREKLNTVDGWGIIGAVATTMNTPTRGMEYEEAVQFYFDILDNIKSEIAKEKQEGIFDEEKFYKKKLKESSLSKISF